VSTDAAKKALADEESFCCMASSDKDDFCGKFFPGAKVFKDKHCGSDWMTCHTCGGHAKWCSPKKDGIDTKKITLEVTDGRGYLLPKNPQGTHLHLVTNKGAAEVKVAGVVSA